jgi:hypothetical protein
VPVNPKTLANLVKWRPGQSGNPGGRGRLDPVLKAKVRSISPEMFDRLRELAMHDEAYAIQAIKLILAYAWGSPDTLREEDDGQRPQQAELTVDELRAIARMAMTSEASADGDDAEH